MGVQVHAVMSCTWEKSVFTVLSKGRLSGLILLAASATAGFAQAPLTLTGALDQTLRQHPVMARIDAELRRFAPAVASARQAPALRLGLDVENLGGDETRKPETTLSLAGVLQWGGQADARAGLVADENEALRRELMQQRLDLLGATATRFIALAGAQEALVLATEARTLAADMHAATQRRQQSGAASMADVHRAELTLARAEMKLDSVEQAQASARQALHLAMGRPAAPVTKVIARLDRLPALPSTQALFTQAEASPATKLADARANIARSQLDLARRQARPDIGWRIGVRDDRELEDQSVVLGFSLALGQGRRSQPLQEQARAGLDVAESARQIVQLELQGLLLDAWQALSDGQRQIETLSTRLVPQAEAVVEALRQGYARGRYSLLELSSAQSELNALREQQLRARVNYHQNWVALERLLGRPLLPEMSE